MLLWNSHLSLSRFLSFSLLPMLLLSGCSKSPERPNFQGVPSEPVHGSFKVALFVDDQNFDQQSARIKNHATEVAEGVGCKVEQVDRIAWEPGALSSGLAANFHVTLGSCEMTEAKLEATLDAFSERSDIASAEAEAKIRLKISENDPRKASQTYLQNIHRDQACDLLPTDKGRDIIVAVIDSGVDGDHADLNANLYRNARGDVVGANFVGKGSTRSPDSNWADGNGHGTHVAGLIAATANNAVGIAGVAACGRVKIMPVRVMNANGEGTSIEIDRGVQWAIAQGADVINLSLGGNMRFRSGRNAHPSALYAEAAARGVVVFAAAGNDGMTLGQGRDGTYTYSYPASYDHVISVAASDERNQLSSFSNRGETVDIAAPGDQVLSTVPGGSYQRMSGTSMASPVAAGVYALALGTTGSKDRISPALVEKLILQATNEGSLRGVASGGVIDAKRLADSLIGEFGETPKLPEPTPAPSPEPQPENPVVTPAPSTDMAFVGLESGTELKGAQRFSVKNWPKGSTARIHLYWITEENPEPRSFVTLTRDNLSADGKEVRTSLAYYLYGSGQLAAEAVGIDGERLQLTLLPLIGL